MKKILQIGEGNFLRAFAEDYIQDTDGWEVVICQPRSNTKVINALKNQNCEYDILIKGRLDGKVIDSRKTVTCVSRCIDTVGEYSALKELICNDDLEIIISNTTEAGICFNDADTIENSPNVSYPAKLTALLYERFKSCKKEVVLLPVELIENNGDELKNCVLKYAKLWSLPAEFCDYINTCHFCNTLVDRIVTGHISADTDPCSVACEPYKSWIIQADEKAQSIIPFDGITYTDDISQYRNRKVRILNGAHTMSVLAGYMSGFDIVRDMVNDKLFSAYITKGLDEIKSTLSVPCDDFADSVIERFNNPFIDHKLLDISLNSVSKFRARCLDSIIDYYNANGVLPMVLTFGLSALIAFYLKIGDREYKISDDEAVLKFFDGKPDIKDILSNYDLWNMDLCTLDGIENTVSNQIDTIINKGIIKAVEEVVYE